MQIPKNIKREHILEALKRIDEEGYSPENESRSYDLFFEGKNYPPKVVIAYANIIAGNKEELSYDFHGGVNFANKFLEDRGFVIISKSKDILSLNALIELYKKYIKTSEYNELYKWKVVKNFQDNWNVNTQNFAVMLEKCLDPANCNLWTGNNYFPRNMILGMVKFNPTEVKEMFFKLFDESLDISDRIDYFQNKAREIIVQQYPNKDLSTYQDKRAIMVYLTLKYPEKYYLYVHGFYSDFCQVTGMREKPKRSKRGDYKVIYDFISLCDAVRTKLIQNKDLIKTHSERLDYKIHYKETNFNLLTQDFMYFSSKQLIKDDKVNLNLTKKVTENEELKESPKKYWLISIRDFENNWGKWQKEGIAAIEFDKLGNLSKYNSREEMQDSLKELYPGETGKTHSSLACYEFVHVLKPGDVIIVKRGTDFFIGYGIVDSTYFFDDNEVNFKNKIKVNWLKTGEWEKIDAPIVSKILTDITKYPNYVKKILEQLGVDDKKNHLDSTETAYWWLNANPKIWKIDEFEIGQEQSYTSHNDKGNKRRIYEYFGQVQPGDLIVGYESTPNKKVKAVFEVTEGLHIDDDTNEEQITFKIKEFVPYQASWEELSSVKELDGSEVMNNNQGSLFKLTKDEYNIIINRCNTTGEVDKEKYSKKDMLNEVFIGEDKLDNIVNLLKHKKNLIFQGPPGTGKTYIAKRVAYTMLGRKDTSFVETIQFHQSYSYEDFIQGLRPSDNGGFYLKNGIFYELALRAQRDPKNDYFLIIDEINRGNLSKIFGELMMLIENDKRGTDFQINLTYSPNTKFYVPENLYIIGTMNTADRSLAMVDYALRRRFSFIDMEPVFNDRFRNHLKALNVPVNKIDWLLNGLNDINELIEKDSNLGRDYRIGHSYFCSIDEENIEDHLRNIINYEIKPLLEEYWFDNKTKVDDCLKRFK